MKKTISLFIAIAFVSLASAQLKAKPKCDLFIVDILNGTVNNLKPNRSIEELKQAMPCFTSEEDASSKCGAGLSYRDKDIYFYTTRNYVEIGEKFQGKLSVPLLGANRKNIFKWVGNPKIKDDKWDAYEMAYGTLVLHYDGTGKVILIQFSTKPTDILSLCE